MKEISILMLILLTACGIWKKDEVEIKKIGHDAVDEIVDDGVKANA